MGPSQIWSGGDAAGPPPPLKADRAFGRIFSSLCVGLCGRGAARRVITTVFLLFLGFYGHVCDKL